MIADLSDFHYFEKVAPPQEEGLSAIHETEDGAVHMWASLDKTGDWKALLWGTELAGVRHFLTVNEANGYLLDSFWRMFPEHSCSGHCGTLDAVAQKRAAEKMNACDYADAG
jgi:hypothetical protein